jgi:GT2 family glycosyltransferase
VEAGRLPALRLIRNAQNLGFCGANNVGFAASRSRYAALLNADAEAEPGWLSAMVAALESHPAAGMAAAKIVLHSDPRRIDKVGHLIYPDGQNRGRGSGEVDRGQYDRMEEVLLADGCAALYRREALDEAGGFDEDFFAFGDDAELGLRLRIAGWTCIYVPDGVVRHHRGGSVQVGSPSRLFWIERNRVLLAAKLFPWSLLVWNVPYYLLRLAGGAAAALTRRGEISRYSGLGGKWAAARALLAGDLAAMRLVPKMLWKRREVRRIARLTPAEVRQLILRHRIGVKAISESII